MCEYVCVCACVCACVRACVSVCVCLCVFANYAFAYLCVVFVSAIKCTEINCLMYFQ